MRASHTGHEGAAASMSTGSNAPLTVELLSTGSNDALTVEPLGTVSDEALTLEH